MPGSHREASVDAKAVSAFIVVVVIRILRSVSVGIPVHAAVACGRTGRRALGCSVRAIRITFVGFVRYRAVNRLALVVVQAAFVYAVAVSALVVVRVRKRVRSADYAVRRALAARTALFRAALLSAGIIVVRGGTLIRLDRWIAVRLSCWLAVIRRLSLSAAGQTPAVVIISRNDRSFIIAAGRAVRVNRSLLPVRSRLRPLSRAFAAIAAGDEDKNCKKQTNRKNRVKLFKHNPSCKTKNAKFSFFFGFLQFLVDFFRSIGLLEAKIGRFL